METTTNPQSAPTALYPTQPMPKKSGCGCFLWGCFICILLTIVLVIGSYVGIRYATDWIVSDEAVTWGYGKFIRPRIEQALPATMSNAEKQRILSQTDSALREFMAMSPEEKKVLKQEALTAMYYYSQNQIIPPEKIPNLARFIQKYLDAIQNSPAGSPRLLQ